MSESEKDGSVHRGEERQYKLSVSSKQLTGLGLASEISPD